MIKDRGMMKWQGMMLTEHVSMLNEYNQDLKRIPKPQLDEWDYDAIQHTLDASLRSKADTKVKLWRDGEFIYRRGTIESINIQRRTLELDTPFSLIKLNVDEIVDVTIID
ncbi:YolD-like family protein [Psychrobacillus sp. FSL K6-1464]|uniref:YolD-like family protein n=1 Tax=Psychrobacillus sp. FSL K6-1464 TaxID=2921545 RepID=UPI0030FB277B